MERVIEQLKTYDEVIAIILFGSYAKNVQTPLSDIDICIIVDRFDEDLEADIGSMYSKDIDLVLFHKLPLRIQFEVLKHGKVLYCKDEEKFVEIKFKVLRSYLEMARIYEKIKREILNDV